MSHELGLPIFVSSLGVVAWHLRRRSDVGGGGGGGGGDYGVTLAVAVAVAMPEAVAGGGRHAELLRVEPSFEDSQEGRRRSRAITSILNEPGWPMINSPGRVVMDSRG